MDPQYKAQLKDLGLIPREAELIFPPLGSPIRADWVNEEWACMYDYPFRLKLVVAYFDSMMSIIRGLNVPLCQLMSDFRRIVVQLEHLRRKPHFVWTFDIACVVYEFRRYTLDRIGIRNKEPVLIPVPESSEDRNWANQFLFVRTSSLGEFCSFLEISWNPKAIEIIESVFHTHLVYSHQFSQSPSARGGSQTLSKILSNFPH